MSLLNRSSLRLVGRLARSTSCSQVRWASAEEMKAYREAPYFERSRRYDVAVIKQQGRAFEPGTSLKPLYELNKAEYFPIVKGVDLKGNDVDLPDQYKSNCKLVAFSFNDYGFEMLDSWLKPFCEKYPQAGGQSDVKAVQICWVEYGFLRRFKSMFVKSMSPKIAPDLRDQTVITFGNKWGIAEFLLLPSIMTNYVYLLDRNNRIRWKGSGKADPADLNVLYEHIEKLRKEPHL